jgi:hypothetical protein
VKTVDVIETRAKKTRRMTKAKVAVIKEGDRSQNSEFRTQDTATKETFDEFKSLGSKFDLPEF